LIIKVYAQAGENKVVGCICMFFILLLIRDFRNHLSQKRRYFVTFFEAQ